MANPSHSVLLVVSDPRRISDLRNMLAMASSISFEVIDADNIFAALEVLGKRSFSVIVSSIRLEGSRGLDSLVRYREICADTPVITLLNEDEKDIVLEAAQSLSDDCIFYKNLDTDRLLTAISIAMDRRQMIQDLRDRQSCKKSRNSTYRALLNRLDQAVFLVNRDTGKLIFASDLAETWFGDSIDSVLSDVFDYGVLNGEDLELEICLSDRSPLLANAELRSVSLEWGGSDCCLISLRNISKRKRAESAYKSAQRRLEFALKASGVGFWSWDLRESKLNFSDIWNRQIGYTRKEFPNTLAAYREAIHPEDRQRAVSEFRSFLRGTQKDLEHTFRLLHFDGSYRQILCRAEVFPDGDGKLALVLGTHLDVTERHALENADSSPLVDRAADSSRKVAKLVQTRIERYADEMAEEAAGIREHFRSDSKNRKNDSRFRGQSPQNILPERTID